MKEQYVPIEPIKKGVRVAAFSGKAVFEAIKPIVEPRMKRNIAELLNELFGSK